MVQQKERQEFETCIISYNCRKLSKNKPTKIKKISLKLLCCRRESLVRLCAGEAEMKTGAWVRPSWHRLFSIHTSAPSHGAVVVKSLTFLQSSWILPQPWDRCLWRVAGQERVARYLCDSSGTRITLAFELWRLPQREIPAETLKLDCVCVNSELVSFPIFSHSKSMCSSGRWQLPRNIEATSRHRGAQVHWR